MHGNKNLDSLITLMSNLTNQYFPPKMLSLKQYKTSKNPWIMRGILTSLKQKNRLYPKYLRTRSSNSLNNYIKYKNKLIHVKELAKRNYLET